MRRSLPFLMLLILLCSLFVACGSTTTGSTSTPTASPVTLNIFAAASLKESFTDLTKQYHQAHPTISFKLNFAGSQILEQQIASGAPADVFASADLSTMKKASDASLVTNSQVFVKNKLAVILPAGNPGNITSLKDLARKGVKIDLAANTVPVGKYTLQVLKKMSASPDYGTNFSSEVQSNVVSQETDVKAVVQKVQLGEVDAGFSYLTDVTPAITAKVKMLAIPDNFNVIAQYPVAVTKNSAHATDAQAFVQYLLSADGQAIMQKYHFTPVNS